MVLYVLLLYNVPGRSSRETYGCAGTYKIDLFFLLLFLWYRYVVYCENSPFARYRMSDDGVIFDTTEVDALLG